MAIQQEKGGFVLRSAIGALTESLVSFWKPMLVAAPLIGTVLFLASGTQAQTSSSPAPSASTTANGPVAPIASPEAARRKGPKEKRKEATARVANPSTPGVPAADVPIAPIDAPDAARTGRPKERDPTPTNDSVASPPVTTEPVAQPTERRREGPKGDGSHGRTETPAPDTQPAGRRKKGPKGDVDHGRTETPAPDTQPAGRRREGPKGAVDHGRTSTTPLIIGALGAVTVLALVVSSGNDRPASP
jgi:hypothetical protein